MHRILPAFITAVILLLSVPYARADDTQSQDPVQEQQLEKGIHIDNIDRDTDGTIAWIKIRVLTDTAIEETWEVIQGLEDWDKAMDLISKVEILGEENEETRYKLFVSPPWPLGDFDSSVRVRKTSQPHLFLYWVEKGFMQGTFGKMSAGEEPGGGSWILFENYGSAAARFPDWMVKIGIHLVVPSVLKDIHERILEVTSQHRRAQGDST